MVFDPSTLDSQPSTHLPAFDGNGNVMALVNAVGRFGLGGLRIRPLRRADPDDRPDGAGQSVPVFDEVHG